MKPQARPPIVEIKRKRGAAERGRSMWDGVDLSAAAAAIKAEPGELPDDPPVDSGVPSVDVEIRHKPQVGHHMADPQEADLTQLSRQTPENPEAPALKPKTARVKKAKTEPGRRVAKEAAKPAAKAAEAQPVAVRGKRKIHSQKERAHKLDQIEKAIGRGVSIKSATHGAGISEQTYYQWKKAAALTPTGDELKDLVALEAENVRLKKLLADRLRKENAELKKKLGLG